jgi:NADH dehydrogenase FAD-containing subunit
MSAHRVVIVGGGFGGLQAALEVAERGRRIWGSARR